MSVPDVARFASVPAPGPWMLGNTDRALQMESYSANHGCRLLCTVNNSQPIVFALLLGLVLAVPLVWWSLGLHQKQALKLRLALRSSWHSKQATVDSEPRGSGRDVAPQRHRRRQTVPQDVDRLPPFRSILKTEATAEDTAQKCVKQHLAICFASKPEVRLFKRWQKPVRQRSPRKTGDSVLLEATDLVGAQSDSSGDGGSEHGAEFSRKKPTASDRVPDMAYIIG